MACLTSAKMKQHALLLCFALLVCCVELVSLQDSQNPSDTSKTSGTTGDIKDPASAGTGDASVSHGGKPLSTVGDNSTNCEGNSTTCVSGSGYIDKLSEMYQKGTIKRAFYVLIGITGIVVIYFIVRTVKSRRKRSKSKKYGVISMPGNDLEMAPLDADDDEDDVTVFEVNGHK